MKERNRFSIILEHLLSMANLKNYTLAKELQYDESYVSKWRSGKLLPTEKNYDKILTAISKCVVDSLDDESILPFYNEYQISNRTDLQAAIFEHLEIEYNYVKDLKNTTGTEIAATLSYYPDMPLSQFIQKMKHPSLRKVSELDVWAIADILHMDNNYHFVFTDFNLLTERNLTFPNVHFSMFIDYSDIERKATYTAIYFMNMLTTLSSIDFALYGGKQARDKVIFTIKDAFSISGMLIDKSHCLSVTVNEDINAVNPLQKQIQALCTKENLLIKRTSIFDIIDSYEYEQTLFSQNQRWLLGHPTEHSLPDDLHEELLQIHFKDESPERLNKLRHIHKLTSKIFNNTPIKLLIHESALSDFAVLGTLDFYGRKIHLTTKQRLRYISYLYEALTSIGSIELRTVKSGVIDDLQHIPSPTLFLSDTFSYMCLETNHSNYTICAPNKAAINHIFLNFFDEFWTKTETEQGSTAFLNLLRHILYSIQIIAETNE